MKPPGAQSLNAVDLHQHLLRAFMVSTRASLHSAIAAEGCRQSLADMDGHTHLYACLFVDSANVSANNELDTSTSSLHRLRIRSCTPLAVVASTCPTHSLSFHSAFGGTGSLGSHACVPLPERHNCTHNVRGCTGSCKGCGWHLQGRTSYSASAACIATTCKTGFVLAHQFLSHRPRTRRTSLTQRMREGPSCAGVAKKAGRRCAECACMRTRAFDPHPYGRLRRRSKGAWTWMRTPRTRAMRALPALP
jgi:hypothetical protein